MTSFMDKNGLTIKRQNQIKREMLEDIALGFKNINEEIDAEDAILGNLVDAVASQIADCWQGMQEVYDSSNPDVNEGKNLDDSGALSNIERLEATSTKVLAALTGNVGTKISKDFVLKCTANNELFLIENESILQVDNCINFTAKINETIVPNRTYTIVIDGKETSYTSKNTDKPIDVCKGLVNAFNVKNFTITQNENLYTIKSNDFSKFNPFIDQYQSIKNITNIFLFSSVNYGAIICPPESLKIIPSPIQGLISAINPEQPKALGRLLESEVEFRLRRSRSGSISGQNTLPALKAKLRDLTGVSTADIIENYKIIISPEGLPAKSFQVIIEGGEDYAIAQTIWQNKPAGIEPFGVIKIPVLIETDEWFDIYFSRPKDISILVKIEINVNNDFPLNGEILVRESLLKYGNSLGINKNIIDQKFFGSIFSACIGILNIKLLVAKKSDNIFKNEIKIGRTEYATFEPSDIMVVKNVQKN